MSDLRFSCPYCGQHVQCEASHADENIPCPSCAQLIRVPRKAEVVPVKPAAQSSNPFTADESKVSYTRTNEPIAEKVPTLDEALEHQSSSPNGHAPVTEREQQIAAARASHHTKPISQVKPRLSFILSGGQAPPPEENKSALSEEQKKAATPDKLKAAMKSLSE